MCGERQHRWSGWWTAFWENTTLCGNQHWGCWGLFLRDTGLCQIVPVSCLDKLIQSTSLPQGRLSRCWLHLTWLMVVSLTAKILPPGRFFRQLHPCSPTLIVRNKFLISNLILSCCFRHPEKDNRQTSARCDLGAAGLALHHLTQTERHLVGLSSPMCHAFSGYLAVFRKIIWQLNHLKVVFQHEAGGSTKRWQWGKCHTDATKVKNML